MDFTADPEEIRHFLESQDLLELVLAEEKTPSDPDNNLVPLEAPSDAGPITTTTPLTVPSKVTKG